MTTCRLTRLLQPIRGLDATNSVGPAVVDRARIVLVALACALPAACTAPPAATVSAPVHTLDGKTVEPFSGRAGSLVLFIYLVDGCPIANALSPEIARISADARDRGAAVWLVYPDPLVVPATIERRHRDFGLDVPTLLDAHHTTVRATGATISPEAALVRLDGAGGIDLLYRGRINDLFEGPGRRRPSARTNDLRVALDAAFAGRRPDPDRTAAVGCILEPVP
ncbi:MAG: redoxin domain-containing protein [Phycisphaerae bacterium]|nr:redoxin domain-containing protein [Phycisphaerae bacterium]